MTNRTRLGAIAAMIVLATRVEAQSLLSTNGNVIAYTGAFAPGAAGATYTASFDTPAIADDGTVFFRAQMESGDVTGPANNRALFRGTTSSDLATLLRNSDPAPGLPGLSLIDAGRTQGLQGNCRISPDGRMFWSSYLSGPGVLSTSNSAIFGGLPGSLAVYAREGDVAPGTAGAVFSGDLIPSIQFSAINRNGAALFMSGLAGAGVTPSNNQALFAGAPGAVAVVVRKGDTVLPNSVTGSPAPSGQTQMDGAGRVLYMLTLAGPGVSASNDSALFFYTPGSGSTLLLREGQLAPGTVGATFNDSFDTWVPSLSINGFNGSGQFVMTPTLFNGDVVAANNQALYVGSATGGLVMVARKGDPAPGTDAVFAGFVTNLTYINNAGAVLSVVNLAGGSTTSATNMAVYVATPTGVPATPYSLTLVVRAGDPAPGAPGDIFGPVFSQVTAFNDLGQAVFNRDLQGPDVTSGYNDGGVWAWDPVRGLFMVARAGDQIEVSPGSFLTFSTFGYMSNGNTDGNPLGFSNAGKLALNVSWLESGSSVLTVDLGCYPPTGYHVDADGDGYGDANTPPLFVCAGGTPPAGYVLNGADCNDADPTVHPGAVETCNGIDDNCDGTVDNAAAPSGHVTLSVTTTGGQTILSWGASSGATAYDVVSGDVSELRADAGAYESLTQASCLVNNRVQTSVSAGSTPPAPGSGRFFLVRPVNCGGAGTYDEGVASQHAPRDARIQTGGWGCP